MRLRLVLVSMLAAALGLAWVAAPPLAQSPPPMTKGIDGIKRIPLQKFEVGGTHYETVVGVAEIAPNAVAGRHSHFGTEVGYVIEGEATMTIDGQPPRMLKAGDSYLVPPGVIHDAKAGPQGAKVIATYVVEKGKPFATPAK